jgi:formylglycine-generating enzyme required for sulfatase activity
MVQALPEDERPWSFRFPIESTDDDHIVVRFPAGITRENGTGFFRLTVTTPGGSTEAVIYLFPGETGPDGAPGDSPLICEGGTCSIDGDLTVAGDLAAVGGTFAGALEVSGEARIDHVETEDLTVTTSIDTPDCPSGYERDDRRPDIVLCRRAVGGGRFDDVVRVGDIWVDRYESSVWSTEDCSGRQYGASDDWHRVAESFPYHGQFTEPLYACSFSGVLPSRYLTWFQAQAACAASGKHLITNAEWQAAVEGTHDPGSSSEEGACLTSAGSPRNTGHAGATPGGTLSCISFWGAEDMIGNLWEWTSDWYGQGPNGVSGSQPAAYFGDGYHNVDGTENTGTFITYFPAAGMRGGSNENSTRAGVFAFELDLSPSCMLSILGFRCALSYEPEEEGE